MGKLIYFQSKFNIWIKYPTEAESFNEYMKINMGGKVNTNTTVNVYFKYLAPDCQYYYSTIFTV